MKNRLDEKLLKAKVVDIRWERITFFLDVKIEDFAFEKLSDFDFYMVNADFKAKAKLKVFKIKENIVTLSMNITNTGNCECLPFGEYNIYVCHGDEIFAKVFSSANVVPIMSDKSRNFTHTKKTRVYTISFFVDESEAEELSFSVKVMDAAACDFRTGEMLFFPSSKKELKRKVIKSLYDFYLKSSPKKKKTVLFMSEQSYTLGSNLTAVYERMKERKMENDYDFIFSARSSVEDHQSMKSWVSLVKKLAKSDFVFIDDHCPCLDWLILDKKTTLIQLWHAGAGFKSSGYSRWGHNACPPPFGAHRQNKYGISGSKQIGKFFAEVFGINDEQILPTGMPRMDEYLDENHRAEKTKEIYGEYPILNGKKVILFAPTYRGKNHADAHYPYELIDFDRLYNFCKNEEYVALFKMHPWVPYPVPIKENQKDCFIDANKYPNINDLFYVTDILITDYSSNIFEYSLMRKPMLFFAFDKIQYSFSRGFHRNYDESAPGKVCESFDSLMNALEEKDYEYEKVNEYVEKHFDNIDSKASDRVIDWTILGKMPEEIKEELKAVEKREKLLKTLDFSSLKSE